MTEILMMGRQYTKIKYQISKLFDKTFKNNFYPYDLEVFFLL